MCCNLEIKVACGFIFAILAVCLSSAAIARNTNWYIDTEVAASPGLAATVSWSATLYSWCLKAPASYVVNNSPAVSFTPTCWSLTESNPPFNPNNDATLNTLQTYIPEIASGLNAIAQGSMYNVAALAVSIALGVVYLILTALIWSAPASLNYMCLSICYKTIGFFWHFASWLGFVLWAGGLGKAQEDFTSNLGTNTQPSQWILVNNTASVAGFSLAVGASGVVSGAPRADLRCPICGRCWCEQHELFFITPYPFAHFTPCRHSFHAASVASSGAPRLRPRARASTRTLRAVCQSFLLALTLSPARSTAMPLFTTPPPLERL